MANVDGSWNTVTHSPMGDQAATLTLATSGDGVTGTFSGAMGNTEIKDGKADGDRVTFAINISVPMPMTLTADVTIDGDKLSGQVTAGAFGSFPIEGTRA